MIKLNDYLYSGDTVVKILSQYADALKKSALETHNKIDLIHCNYLLQQLDILQHNDFLTSQSQRIREFYKYLVKEYPYLAFTFRGRIKSAIRSEEKFNGYIVEFIYEYYKKNGIYPSEAELKERLSCFRDLIAYRFVISVPKCHLKPGIDQETLEIEYLYKIANTIPEFFEERGFSAELAGHNHSNVSPLLTDAVKPYYRDYIHNTGEYGYRSLHITFYDCYSRCFFEIQLRTKDMDDHAEIGPANHLGYEQRQINERSRRDLIPKGECIWFDEAYERVQALQELELSTIDVNMFKAYSNSLINDGCGLFRGRLITPFEHLSRFQNDLID